MLALRRTVGTVLVGIPVLAGVVFFGVALIELPPVRWVALIVVVAGAMIATGNYLLDK
jgi:ABC-type multidrug transport system permease subunit